MTQPGEAAGLEFPCEFAVKAMGDASEDFETLVVGIVARHVPRLDAGSVRQRPSRNGRYLSITVSFTAHSRSQLDDLYRELTAHERVLMVL